MTPINTADELLKRIKYIHYSAYKLCKQSFNHYFPNPGNIGVFCHFDNEYEFLVKLRTQLTEASSEPNRKYFRLHEPIIFPANRDAPEVAYTYLYIRKPDPTPYGQYLGDVDFYTEDAQYNELIKQVEKQEIPGVSLYEQPGVGTMVQLASPDIDIVAYVSTREKTQKVRFRYN